MNYRIFGSLSISAFTLAALAACSSSSSGGSAADACTSYGNALVAYTHKCGGTLDPSQDSAVVARYTKLCQAEIAEPGVASNLASLLSSCASAIGSADCNTNIDQLDACNVQPAGTLADGAVCDQSLQCSSGSCDTSSTSSQGNDGGAGSSTNCGKCVPALADGANCESGGSCVKGDTCKFSSGTDGSFTAVCAPKPTPGAAGAACTDTSQCQSPNHCNVTFTNGVSSGTCAAPVASGGTCQESTDCTSGLVCAGTSTRTCATPLTEGATCTGGDCAAGLACDTTSTKCTKVTFGAVGAACDGVVSLCSKGTCYLSETGTGGTGGTGSSPQTGVCPTIIPDNGACDTTSSAAQCDEFASCTGGTCVFIPATCK